MFTPKLLLMLAALASVELGARAFAGADETPPPSPHLGTPISAAQAAPWHIDVEPNGAALPAGSGTPAEGSRIYAARCAACHGADLRGTPVPGRAPFPALVGGEGSLASQHPKKTVGSYWPYATTVFDYIRRTMPFDHPQSLSSDQVYAVTAFVLAQNHIIGQDATLDRKTLPKVRMPNRDGFYPNRTEGGLETLK
ncbi:MAG TPA: cytochrome c [Candidatus Limnocylindria bacterium]|jgi:cytochrome c|nr:cytochrome c [Candidatus Limnocylindria bacterium]